MKPLPPLNVLQAQLTMAQHAKDTAPQAKAELDAKFERDMAGLDKQIETLTKMVAEYPTK